MPRFIIILQSVALTMAAAVHGNPTVLSNGTSPMSSITLDFMKMQRAAAAASSYADTPLMLRSRNLQKIIGGETAGEGEFPWFGYTRFNVPRRFQDPLIFDCGSSFIHPDIAVSAASCVVELIRNYPRANILVDIFEGYDGSDGGTYESVYEVSDIYWPQGYSFPENDIVFFKILSSTSVTPVSWNTDPLIPLVGDVGTAIGYGDTTNNGPASDTLQKVNISVISNEECGVLLNATIEDSQVCAFTQGKSTCLGDGGGPFLTQTGEIFGLASFLPIDRCDPGPSGFTRVSSFSDMIASVSCCCCCCILSFLLQYMMLSQFEDPHVHC